MRQLRHCNLRETLQNQLGRFVPQANMSPAMARVINHMAILTTTFAQRRAFLVACLLHIAAPTRVRCGIAGVIGVCSTDQPHPRISCSNINSFSLLSPS
jgi:predicted TIM-barrel fold metal-dependent hydrolase